MAVKRTSEVIRVPLADSTNNNTMSEVVGNKTDTHDGDSIYAKVKRLDEHIHTAAYAYPTLAAGVTVTGSDTVDIAIFYHTY